MHELLRWLRGSLLLALLQLASALGAILLSLWLVPLGLRGLRRAYTHHSSSVDSMLHTAAGVVVPPDGKVLCLIHTRRLSGQKIYRGQSECYMSDGLRL